METNKNLLVVRLRHSSTTSVCQSENTDYPSGTSVLVETPNGQEFAEVVRCPKFMNTTAQPEITVIREATQEEIQLLAQIRKREREAQRICLAGIEEKELPMHLIETQLSLDQQQYLFLYTAEHRVDFRTLLPVLTGQLRARVELRQIGQRDRAKLAGGIGPCGQQTCCSRFKNTFETISINMAKTQMLPLNNQKLSGLCGKLMCCLGYEQETYLACREGLPKPNDHIRYEDKNYTVTTINCCLGSMTLRNQEGSIQVSLDTYRRKAGQQS